MKKEKSKRIARVLPPITLGGSALANPRKLNPLEKWLFQYEDPIIFSSYRTQWIEMWRVFTQREGFLWLFAGLPLKLIRGKYDLFVAAARDPQGIITFFISKLLRKPVILFDTFYDWPERTIAHLVWPVNRFMASRATIFCVTSKRVLNFWSKANIPEKKIMSSKIFVSTIEINAEQVLLANEIKEKLECQKIVLFVGRITNQKGLEYLIQAFAQLSKETKNIGLLIVGDGPERKRLETLCRDMKLDNVFFVGFVARQHIAPYFLLSDVFVLPSVRTKTHEEWGLVVNEAMSLGKPVVVTSTVGCAYELVKDGLNGFIVPERTADALYNAIKRLVVDDELRMRVGKAAKKTITESFTYQHAIEDSKNIIMAALKQDRSI